MTVSVVVPFLNPGPFLEEGIESVIAQTYGDWELLLVDDGSSDVSTDIARRYADANPGRIFYLEHPGHRNRGSSASRNLGIRRACGEFIAFLDADDVWTPDKLETQCALLESDPNVVMTYGACLHWFGWSGDPVDQARDFLQDMSVEGTAAIEPTQLVKMFLRSTSVVPSPSGVLARRAAIVAVGAFVERFRGKRQLFEDQVLYVKLALGRKVIVSDRECYKWRQHPDSCCAVVSRSGIYNELRLDFLAWLSRYLANDHPREMELRALVNQELQSLRGERMRASLNGAFRGAVRLSTPKALRQLVRRGLKRARAGAGPLEGV